MTETAPFRILITGSRNWPDYETIFEAISTVIANNEADSYVIVHGGAVGADLMADWAASTLSAEGINVAVEEHPANWTIGRAAGILRNQKMVDLGADVCLSFNYKNSNGTRHCTDTARRADIPVICYTL